MSDFDGIEHATITGSSRNLEPGSYVLRLDGLKVIESKRAAGTKYAIIECNVRSFVPGVRPHLDETIAPTPVAASTFAAGDEVAWKVNMSLGSAMSNLRAFGLEVMRAVAVENGSDPESITVDQITPAVMDTLFAPNGSPAIGLHVSATAFVIFTRANKPFTKVTWTHSSSVDSVEAPPVDPLDVILGAADEPSRDILITEIVEKRPDLERFDFAPYDVDRLKTTLASL